MSDTTPRFGLPLLAAGQAQKELFHNEALTLLDALAQTVVQTLGDNAPPAAPIEGQGWIVGTAPGDAWTGHPGAIALWTAGGWRFVAAPDGMAVWVSGLGLPARRSAGAWSVGILPAAGIVIGGVQVVGPQRGAIAGPSGGTTVDTAARATIGSILTALRAHGLIAG